MKTKLFLFIIAAALLLGPQTRAFDATAKQIQIANEVIPQMIAAGVLRVDKVAGKAWIAPLLWLQLDAQGKADCAAAIAIYCSAKNPVVEIYDAQSARKLANWGWAKGLEVF